MARRYLTIKRVAEALDVPSAHIHRWCDRLGLIPEPGSHNRIRLTVREAIALRAACTLAGRNEVHLASAAANAILTTSSRWLFVRLDQHLEGDTADELLDKWREIGTPTGTVLDTRRLGLVYVGR